MNDQRVWLMAHAGECALYRRGSSYAVVLIDAHRERAHYCMAKQTDELKDLRFTLYGRVRHAKIKHEDRGGVMVSYFMFKSRRIREHRCFVGNLMERGNLTLLG